MGESSGLNRAQEKAQKKKRTILIVLGAATTLFWGRALFGGSDKPDPYELARENGSLSSQGANVGTPGAGAATGAAATRRGKISTFDQAIERMRLWPDALDRQVIEGPIQELVPFDATSPVAEAPSYDPDPDWNIGPVDFGGLGLRLSSTLVLGQDRYAVINGQRVKEGQVLTLQVSGVGVRYLVEAIKPREVHLREGEELHVLRIVVGANKEIDQN